MESDQNSQLNFIDSFVLLQPGNEDCWLYPVNTNDTAGIRFARHPYGSDALVAMMASRPHCSALGSAANAQYGLSSYAKVIRNFSPMSLRISNTHFFKWR
ncbi:hypothetical protein ABXJ76_05240 [Methylobacter sp. G7]|uniref:hypothetical protein n=1 Tax=Methylobacter sp. G7 TaxID=3230117 RepID=UPI003D803D8B